MRAKRLSALYFVPFLALFSLSAHAILPPVNGSAHEYKAYYSVTDTSTELRPLLRQILEYAWSAGIYTGQLRTLSIYESSHKYVNVSADDEKIEKLKAHFSPMGVHFTPVRERWINPAPERLQKIVLANVNQILVEFAYHISSIKPGTNVSSLIANFKARFEQWEERIYPIGENLRTPQVILQENDLYFGARREFTVLERLAQSLSARDNSKFEDRIREASERMRPRLGTNLAAMERVKAKLPHMSNIISEYQREAAYNSGLSPDRKYLEARLSIVESELGDLSEIRSLDEFNKETYEVMALKFLRALNKLETLVTEFEIADVLNRHLPIWNFYLERGVHYNDTRFGPVMLELLTHLSGYNGLLPYNELVLKAMLANSVTGESRKPTDHEINLYQEMWKKMAWKSLHEGSNIKIPVMHYGRLFNPIGLVDVGIIEGLEFIDLWFKSHGIKTVDWTKQKGIDLDIARQDLTQRRTDYLEANGMNGCETLLDQFLRKPKKEE